MGDVEDLGRRDLRVWFLAQVDRQDDVGVIARWVATDPSAAGWPAPGSSIRIEDLVELVQAAAIRSNDPTLLAALVVALEEWSRWVRDLD